jgi:imidazolonepropionase
LSDLFIHNIRELATPLWADRDDACHPVRRISQAAILIRNGRIAGVGAEADLALNVSDAFPRLDAHGALALPGLVDCHTHPVFVGNRAAEFHLRNAGKSYLEIAAAGGGIQASARKVQAASIEQIVEESLPRFYRSLACGVTTIEAKSGYGLEWEGERKLLDAIRHIAEHIPQRVYRTFLIHALPESFAERRDAFIHQVLDEMIPAIAAQKLASSVDVFCETGAFTVEESRRCLLKAKELGLRVMIHANQFGHSGGARLAAELGAASAHHLEYLNDAEINALAQAKTVAVILTASVFFLGTLPYPPVRQMLESGLRVAVATDMNPGSAMTESLPFCLTAAAIYGKMTPDELLWSVTLDAARALDDIPDFGSLEPNKSADVTLWNVPDMESLSYHLGDLRALCVIIGGTVALRDCNATRRY